MQIESVREIYFHMYTLAEPEEFSFYLFIYFWREWQHKDQQEVILNELKNNFC